MWWGRGWWKCGGGGAGGLRHVRRQGHSPFHFDQIISMLVVAYISICSYYTVFKIRIFNLYHLVPRHLTDEYSLLFSAV